MTKATNRKIIVLADSLSGKMIDNTTRGDGKAIVFDQTTDKYIHVDLLHMSDITFEVLSANNDVGQGANQVAIGNHDHDVGNLQVLFENRIV